MNQVNPELIAEFKETIEMLTERGIKVALVNTPTLDLLNNFEPDKYNMMVDWFQTYANAEPLVEYWDFNPEYSSHHELFHDRLHLNAEGQKVISPLITGKIKGTLKMKR